MTENFAGDYIAVQCSRISDIAHSTTALLAHQAAVLDRRMAEFARDRALAAGVAADQAGVIRLNIGGTVFPVSKRCLLSPRRGLFHVLFSGSFNVSPQPDGTFFIDRDPALFPIVLSYLRGGAAALVQSIPRYLTPLVPSSYIPSGHLSALATLRREFQFYGLSDVAEAVAPPMLLYICGRASPPDFEGPADPFGAVSDSVLVADVAALTAAACGFGGIAEVLPALSCHNCCQLRRYRAPPEKLEESDRAEDKVERADTSEPSSPQRPPDPSQMEAGGSANGAAHPGSVVNIITPTSGATARFRTSSPPPGHLVKSFSSSSLRRYRESGASGRSTPRASHSGCRAFGGTHYLTRTDCCGADSSTWSTGLRWRKLDARLSSARDDASAVVVGGFVHLVGGCTGAGTPIGLVERLSTGECTRCIGCTGSQFLLSSAQETAAQHVCANDTHPVQKRRKTDANQSSPPAQVQSSGAEPNAVAPSDRCVSRGAPLVPQWDVATGLPNGRAATAVAVVAVGRSIYLFGGDNGEGPVSECFCYDTSLLQWTDLPPLPRGPRSGAAAVACRNRLGSVTIVVIGGCSSSESSTDVLLFDPESAEWTIAPLSLSTGRSRCAAAVLSWPDCPRCDTTKDVEPRNGLDLPASQSVIVVAGGIGQDDDSLNSVEVLSLERLLTGMLKPLRHCCGIVTGAASPGAFFVIGSSGVVELLCLRMDPFCKAQPANDSNHESAVNGSLNRAVKVVDDVVCAPWVAVGCLPERRWCGSVALGWLPTL